MTAGRKRGQRFRNELTRPEIGLDATAREVLDLSALLLARRNYSRQETAAYFEKVLNSIPDSVGLTPEDADERRYPIAAKVLSRWYLLPSYVLNGQPRPLPAKGRISVTSLVRAVNSRAAPSSVLQYLLKTGAVNKVGDRFVPQDRVVRHRFSPRLQRMHHVDVVLGLLRTVEGNARQSNELRQFQFITEAVIPDSRRQNFASEVAEPANELLKFSDSVGFRLAQNLESSEEQAHVSLSIHVNDGRRLPPLSESSSSSILRPEHKRSTRKKKP